MADDLKGIEKGPLLCLVVPWRDDPQIVRLLQHLLKEKERSSQQFEVVVVDDHSGSYSSDVEKWMQILLSQTLLPITFASPLYASGPGAARNTGLSLCNSPFVVFTDSDDLPDVLRLLHMASVIQKDSADVAIGSYSTRKGEKEFRYPVPKRRTSRKVAIAALENMPGVWRYVFLTRWLRDHKLRFPSASYAEDLVFLFEVLNSDPSISVVNDICYEHFQHQANSLSTGTIPHEDIDGALTTLQELAHQLRDEELRQAAAKWMNRIYLRGLFQRPPKYWLEYIRTVHRPSGFSAWGAALVGLRRFARAISLRLKRD